MAKRVKTVLISGASIAGPVLAYWLAQYGFQVTVVERAPSIRVGGQNIDVNGPARRVVQKMGIEQAIRDANTGEVGTQWVDKANQVKAAFPKAAFSSLTQELEILRGDLVAILYELTKEPVTYRFDDQITALTQDEQQAHVTFKSGDRQSFDLVIAADGVRSKTRELMFGKQPVFHYMGLITAYLTIPKTNTDTNWTRWYTADQSRMVQLRPDNKGTTRACISFLMPKEEFEHLDRANRKTILIDKLTDAGWESPRLIREVERNDDIYFDGVGQIKAPAWFTGRLGMIGDAAYGPGPITGKGCTLAMVGAYILAGELAKFEQYSDGISSYESIMRPYVEAAQKLEFGVPWIVFPKTALGVWALNTLASVFASKPIQKLGRLFTRSESQKAAVLHEDTLLPDYDFLRKSSC